MFDAGAAAGLPMVRMLHSDTRYTRDTPDSRPPGWCARWTASRRSNATLTWDMAQADGSVLTAHDIKLRSATATATVLDGRFTKICTVRETLAGAEAPAQ